jgi:hypothetical protein
VNIALLDEGDTKVLLCEMNLKWKTIEAIEIKRADKIILRFSIRM